MSDLRIQHTEEMVGAGHATKADTLNRLCLAEHSNDGTHRKLTQVTDPYVDVRAYGADPAGAADSTAAFTSALAAGHDVYMPPGNYKITSTLAINSKRLKGAGSRATAISYTGTGGCLDVTGSDATPSVLEGFSITGTPSGSSGILIDGGLRRSMFRDLYITGFTGAGAYGIDLCASMNNGIYYNYFEKVGVSGCTAGMRLFSSDGAVNGYRCNANTFVMCSLNNSSSNGLLIDYANGNTFIGLDTEGNGAYGINIDHTYEATFAGGYSENNSSGGVLYSANSARVHYFGRRTIDAISGPTTPGLFFNSDNLIVDPSGNVTAATFKSLGGIGVNNSGANSNALNFDSATMGTISMAGTTCLGVNSGVSSGQAALLVRVNDGAVTSLRQVTVGAVDSGGAGYRLLRVAN